MLLERFLFPLGKLYILYNEYHLKYFCAYNVSPIGKGHNVQMTNVGII